MSETAVRIHPGDSASFAAIGPTRQGEMTQPPEIALAASPSLREDVARYQAWKTRLTDAIASLRLWLEEQGPVSADAPERLEQSLSALREDRLTIAFLGEFSRGKTELINAMFFAGLGRRLLPSTAGRTTMCPTEILWDASSDEPYLGLLPIETRAKKAPVSQLKLQPERWVRFRLDPEAPAQMQATLKKLTDTKELPLAEAATLGFNSAEAGRSEDTVPAGGIEVPCWRHAVISFPHPLLKQGLVVLDTPGLNALGSEPELTLGTLPSAQAILFVLAADTGVTRSDLDIWEHYVRGLRYKRQALAVVLNKVDTLWDDLMSGEEIEAEIRKQQTGAARTLGLDPDAVFAVSAQKALLARVRQDEALLSRSCLEGLERHLSSHLVRNKSELILDGVETSLGNLIETNAGRLSSRLEFLRSQTEEFQGLDEKSKDVVAELMRRTRQEQRGFIGSVKHFQTSHRRLLAEADSARRILDLKGFDELIGVTQRAMERKLTTRGLSVAMKHLFDAMNRTMHTLTVECERLRRLVLLVYEHFEQAYRFTPVPPRGLAPMIFRAELESLSQEAEAYRKSSKMLLAEQHFVVKRFFAVLVARVRDIFQRFASEFEEWLNSVLEPLRLQILERKEQMEQRLTSLKRISRSKSSLDGRLQRLEAERRALSDRLDSLRAISTVLRARPPEAAISAPAPDRPTARRAVHP